MREELEKLATAGKISRQDVEALIELTTAGYCSHRSWGVGKLTTVDTVFSRLTIDFPGKPGHSMDLSFAAGSLKPIPSDHILARKISDLPGLRQRAALDHLDLIKLVLDSYGGRATLDQIQSVLVPDVITEDWKKWWDTAKRELKKNGHFQVPIKKSDPIVYQAEEVSLQNRLLEEFRAAKGLKARIAVATELHKNLEDLDDRNTALTEVISFLNSEIHSHRRTQTPLALEAIFIRNDLRRSAQMEGSKEEGEVEESEIWAENPNVAELLDAVPAPKYKRALQSFKEARPEIWDEIIIEALNSVSTKLCTEAARLLVEEGKLDKLKPQLARLISQHQASSELLLWLAKERSDAYADILGPEVFRAMLTVMERDQFNEKKSNRLRDYILSDHRLVLDLIASADIEVIKDVTRALQFCSCFDDMDKRSILARIVKSYPAVQSLISGEATRQEGGLIVSWASLERRKKEYQDLVQKKIPANSKEIAIARSYGDLRENHEYKAAKEMQKLLMKRKAELESQIVRARGTDFANTRTDVAGVGAVVNLTDLNTGQKERYSILGAWDSDPAKGIMSYLSPLAQALLNKKPGDKVEFDLDGQRKHFQIESVEVSQEIAASPAPAAAQEVGASAEPASSEPTEPGGSETASAAPLPEPSPSPAPQSEESSEDASEALPAPATSERSSEDRLEPGAPPPGA